MRAVAGFAVLLLLLPMLDECEQPPGGGPPRVIEVFTPDADPCFDTGCYRGIKLDVRGSGFQAGTQVKVYLPAVADQPRLKEFVIGDRATVGGDGRFESEANHSHCVVVADYEALQNSLAVAVDSMDGRRLAFNFVTKDRIACRPAFAVLSYLQPCGQPFCPTLSNDSATSIGVHWGKSKARYGGYFIRYGRINVDQAQWTKTRSFGSDVTDVAINNLEPRMTYGFQILPCITIQIIVRCDEPWFDIGEAAPR